MDIPINYKNARHCNGKEINPQFIYFYNSHTNYTYGRGYLFYKEREKKNKLKHDSEK